MNLVEAYTLAIREIDRLRRQAKYNAKYEISFKFKEGYEFSEKEYAEAKRLLEEERKKNDNV